MLRQLIAALPVGAWRDGVTDVALAAAAGRVGLTLAEAEALQLAGPLRRLARSLRGFAADFSWAVAVPFEVQLGTGTVHGTLDLSLSGAAGEAAVSLVPGAQAESPASVTVLVEALRAQAGDGRQVRAALFALDGGEERLLWASESPVPSPDVEARLCSALAAGTSLAEHLERHRCEALGCGFVRRCHPSERGL